LLGHTETVLLTAGQRRWLLTIIIIIITAVSMLSTLLRKDGTIFSFVKKYFASRNGLCKLFVQYLLNVGLCHCEYVENAGND